jgi:hypothetical protein
MTTVSVTRRLDAAPEAVRDAIADHEAFMAAGGFDEVAVEDGHIHLTNRVGIATIDLDLAVVDAADAALAYEQREGIFEEMYTEYRVRPDDGGSEVRARTTFTLGGILGDALDATVIKRQRRREITAQFDYLASTAV